MKRSAGIARRASQASRKMPPGLKDAVDRYTEEVSMGGINEKVA